MKASPNPEESVVHSTSKAQGDTSPASPKAKRKRRLSARSIAAYALGSGFLVVGFCLIDMAPVAALLLGLCGLLALGYGQVASRKRPAAEHRPSFTDSLKDAAMVPVWDDSETAQPPSVAGSSR